MNIPARSALMVATAALIFGCGENTADASAPLSQSGGAGEACVTRLSATMMGKRIDNTSCIENVSQPSGEFRAGCEQAAEAGDAMQSDASAGIEIHESSTQFTSRGCPANAVARCDGVNNGQVNFHYIGHSSEELAALERACSMRGGRWQG